jgi:hypothetical protein
LRSEEGKMADPVLTSPLNVTAPEPAGIAEFKTVAPLTVESSTSPDKVDLPSSIPASDTKPVASAVKAKSNILLRSPRRYNITEEGQAWQAPKLEWLEGTWSVTHSTLPMWRKAKNVRITYKILPPSTPTGPTLLDDTVESVPTQRTLLPQPKAIHGVDTPDGDGAWAWRGRGLLKIASSKWEVLGWGEKDGERWVVTWFAPSVFTPAGVDVYSSRKEGISEGLFKEVERALEDLGAKEVAELCKREMRGVEIEY